MLAVLDDGAARDVDAALLEFLREGLVAHGFGLVFALDDLEERRLDGLPAHVAAGFVAGAGVSLNDICGERSLDSSALSIFADDRLLDECAGPALIQTINSSLKWLTEVVRDRGDRLSAGQIILTGSIPSLIPIAEDCGIRVDAPPFGSVEVKFIA